MKNILYLIMMLPLLTACGGMGECTEGNGFVSVSESVTDAFQEVEVDGSMEVYLHRGTDHLVKIEADSNLHRHVKASVKRGKLSLSIDGCIKNTSPLRIYVTAPLYRNIALDGSGSISSTELISAEDELGLSVDGSGNISMEVHAKKINAEIDGSGSITLKGTANGQVVDVEGSGKYRALGLRVQETVIKLSGSGEVETTAEQALTVSHKGSGTIRYRGTPGKINSDVSGSGKLEQVQ